MMQITKDNVSLYTETLFALARDAWRKGRLEAFDFIVKDYLTGLVPSVALDAFISSLDPDHGTNVRARIRLDDSKPNGGSGGTLIPVPKPPAPLPPAPVRLRESDSIKW